MRGGETSPHTSNGNRPKKPLFLIHSRTKKEGKEPQEGKRGEHPGSKPGTADLI